MQKLISIEKANTTKAWREVDDKASIDKAIKWDSIIEISALLENLKGQLCINYSGVGLFMQSMTDNINLIVYNQLTSASLDPKILETKWLHLFNYLLSLYAAHLLYKVT